jgi:hypothetical protein
VNAIVVGLDADPTNNARLSASFHVALPTLRITAMPGQTTFDANVPARVDVVVENVSRHAAMPAATLAFCLYELGAACARADGATAFGPSRLDALAAAGSASLKAVIAVPGGAANQNLIDTLHLSACIGMAGADTVALLDGDDRVCSAAAQVSIRPDYASCGPARLTADAAAEAPTVCARPCAIQVYAVDVRPGRTYVIEADGQEDQTLRWRDRYRGELVDASAAPGLQPAIEATVYAVTAPKFCGSAPHPVVLRDMPFGG